MRDRADVLLGDQLWLSVAQIAFYSTAQKSFDTGGTKQKHRVLSDFCVFLFMIRNDTKVAAKNFSLLVAGKILGT